MEPGLNVRIIAAGGVLAAALAACSPSSPPVHAQAATTGPRPAASAGQPPQCAEAMQAGTEIAPLAALAGSGAGYPSVTAMKRWHRDLSRLAGAAGRGQAAGLTVTQENHIKAAVIKADSAILPAIDPAGLNGPPAEHASSVPWRTVAIAAGNLEAACKLRLPLRAPCSPAERTASDSPLRETALA